MAELLTPETNLPILKAEWLMNSPCQLHCSYCAIAHRSISELSFTEKKRVLDKFKEFGIFPVIYGGEVTLSKDFASVLAYLKTIEIPYAVISNGLVNLYDLHKWVKLYELKNWSVSIDTLDFKESKLPSDMVLKSRAGYATLLFTDGLIPDRVANVTVTNKNFSEIKSIVDKLSSIGVWSLFNLVNTQKPGFEFSAIGADDLSLTQDQINYVADELILMKSFPNVYKIHNSKETFEMWKAHGLNQDWHCSELSKFVIDCDGTLRCCVDWKGEYFGKLKFWDLTKESFERIYQMFITDIWKCSGCAWSSTKDAEVFQTDPSGREKLIHLDAK